MNKKTRQQAAEHLARGIKMLGGPTTAARYCGKKQGHVQAWQRTGLIQLDCVERFCSATRVMAQWKGCDPVEPWQVRPDQFGED